MKRWRRRTDAAIDQVIDAVTWHKPPASASPRVPGSRPGPGTPFTPPSMTPGPGSAPVCVFSFLCFDDGHAEILDHRRHTRITVPATAAPDFDAWLKDITS